MGWVVIIIIIIIIRYGRNRGAEARPYLYIKWVHVT